LLPKITIPASFEEISANMYGKKTQMDSKTLLVFNCHEPWIYQLGALQFNLDIVIGLKGRYRKTWDKQMRPLPPCSRLITLSEALESPISYHCIIAHNISDLLDVKTRHEPRLIVLHSTLQGRLYEEESNVQPRQVKHLLQQYLKLIGGHAVAVSMFKGESWGLTEDIVHPSVDPNDYPPYSGHIACGLRICNFVNSRKKILLWDFHEKAFSGVPVRLVGHNPNMPGVRAADNWNQLKKIMQSHRFYIHTADPRFEAGYNMATIEAMAAGLPVLSNIHPTSPVEHGVSGFLSNNPDELRRYAEELLKDRELAASMGCQARKNATERFSTHRFKHAFLRSIEIAHRKWHSKEVSLACPILG